MYLKGHVKILLITCDKSIQYKKLFSQWLDIKEENVMKLVLQLMDVQTATQENCDTFFIYGMLAAESMLWLDQNDFSYTTYKNITLISKDEDSLLTKEEFEKILAQEDNHLHSLENVKELYDFAKTLPKAEAEVITGCIFVHALNSLFGERILADA